MPRRIRYQEIADELRLRVSAASPGSLLSSESELSREFSASRVTVRKALEALREEGAISARQGFGWFVSAEPVRQQLHSLGTIEAQLADSGLTWQRKVHEFEFGDAPMRVARELGVAEVLRVKRVNHADGEPFAVVTVWCPAELGRTLSLDAVERAPFYELLDIPLLGATQTIGAVSADHELAELLKVPVGAPLLQCRRVTTDPEGAPVLMSEHVFAAHRTEFVVELPQAEPSVTPSGLRLVT